MPKITMIRIIHETNSRVEFLPFQTSGEATEVRQAFGCLVDLADISGYEETSAGYIENGEYVPVVDYWDESLWNEYLKNPPLFQGGIIPMPDTDESE